MHYNTCIFCQQKHEFETVEHIVPQALGNVHYILPKGKVCQRCNNRWGKIEGKVVGSTLFYPERIRLGHRRKSKAFKPTELDQKQLVGFALKMGYEALYTSQRKIWEKYDFEELLVFLMKGKDTPTFTSNLMKEPLDYCSIPRWMDRWRLGVNRTFLEYAVKGEHLFFRFTYGRIQSQLCLSKSYLVKGS